MTYYVHESETNEGLSAVTRDKEGAALDQSAGPWKLKKELEEDKTRGAIGFPTDLEKLNQDLDFAGVQYTRVGVHFSATPGYKK
ncbi:hypothetical protein [Agrobacterium tumefaciens]|uniref:hypothetical protein n=1 Tax=Agrobacterium tumefaciens TaxID=358 RepID=UPI003B9DEA35